MKRFLMVIVPALLLVASFGMFARGGAIAQDDDETTVVVSEDPVLGPILTDYEGMTLYLFTKDTTEGESTCYDKCAENWPPFNPEGDDLTLPEGVDGELTRIERTDGTQMVAYNGIPLYYFAKDEAAGDTNGQEVGDVWYVVAPGQEFGDPPVMGSAASPEASPAASPVAGVAAFAVAEDPELGQILTDD
jgi:predicted lipoprotein with Yx(FWY)xxD motif